MARASWPVRVYCGIGWPAGFPLGATPLMKNCTRPFSPESFHKGPVEVRSGATAAQPGIGPRGLKPSGAPFEPLCLVRKAAGRVAIPTFSHLVHEVAALLHGIIIGLRGTGERGDEEQPTKGTTDQDAVHSASVAELSRRFPGRPCNWFGGRLLWIVRHAGEECRTRYLREVPRRGLVRVKMRIPSGVAEGPTSLPHLAKNARYGAPSIVFPRRHWFGGRLLCVLGTPDRSVERVCCESYRGVGWSA